MADSTITDLAEMEATLQRLMALFPNMDGVQQKAFESLRSLLGKASVDIKGMGQAVEETFKKLSNEEALKNFDRIKTSIQETLPAVDNLGEKALVMAGFASGVLKVSDAFKSMGSSAMQTTSNVNEMIGATQSFFDRIKSMPGVGSMLGTAMDTLQMPKITEAMKNAAIPFDAMNGVETSLLKAVIASGTLNDSFKDLGGAGFENIGNIEQEVSKLASISAQVGTAVGMSSDQIKPFYVQMLEIPGAGQKMIQMSDDVTKSMSELEAALRLGTVSGRDNKAVIDAMNESRHKFNMDSEDTLKVLSRSTDMAESFNVSVSDMDRAVTKVSENFEMWTRGTENSNKNIEGSINVMGRLQTALKEVGVAPEAALKTTEALANNLMHLDTAQKSFLSSRTGGPGGLRGSAEIDMLIREGKFEQVAEKMQTALSQQFGGRMVGLEDATKTEAGARQYEMQLQMLQKGPYKMADTRDEAMNLVDAFRKGTTGGSGLTPGESLKNAMTKSESLQERHGNTLTQVANVIALGNDFLAQIQRNTAAELIGIAGKDGAGRLMQEQNSARLATEDIIKGGRIEDPLQGAKDSIDRIKNAAHELMTTKTGDDVWSLKQEQMPEVEVGTLGPMSTNIPKGATKLPVPTRPVNENIAEQQRQEIQARAHNTGAGGTTTASAMIVIKCDNCNKEMIKQEIANHDNAGTNRAYGTPHNR